MIHHDGSPFFSHQMEKEIIIQRLTETIKQKFEGDSSGHDWFHIERVWKTAKRIAQHENANVFITELGALLHDIADHKFTDNFEEASINLTAEMLSPFPIDDADLKQVQHIVLNCSYKGGVTANKMQSIEGKIVQDADKLDAIGAIGIARAFAFGGKFGSILYDPTISPIDHQTLESYQKNRSHTINHFYEKLLKLKDLMYSNTARELAQQRHEFMEAYLKQFYIEWEAKID